MTNYRGVVLTIMSGAWSQLEAILTTTFLPVAENQREAVFSSSCTVITLLILRSHALLNNGHPVVYWLLPIYRSERGGRLDHNTSSIVCYTQWLYQWKLSMVLRTITENPNMTQVNNYITAASYKFTAEKLFVPAVLLGLNHVEIASLTCVGRFQIKSSWTTRFVREEYV